MPAVEQESALRDGRPGSPGRVRRAALRCTSVPGAHEVADVHSPHSHIIHAKSMAVRRPSQGPETTSVNEPAGHPSGGSHTASALGSVSAANTRSGEALMTRAAVSARLIAGAP